MTEYTAAPRRDSIGGISGHAVKLGEGWPGVFLEMHELGMLVRMLEVASTRMDHPVLREIAAKYAKDLKALKEDAYEPPDGVWPRPD